jgi:DNA mismatch repair protein MutL
MAYPEVRFTLVSDGRTALQTPGGGALAEAVAGVYGAAVAQAAIEIDAPAQHEGDIGVRGIAVEPRLHRATRSYISLYVNRRWVKNRALTFAVEEAYQGLLPAGRRPIAVLDLRVPADEVDVNVHPTKAEVRLRREREVFGALQRAVRGALAGHATVPAASSSLWSGGAASSVPAFLRVHPVQAPLPRAADLHAAQPPPTVERGDMHAAQPPAVDGHVTSPPSAPGSAITAPAESATMVERLPMLRAVGQVGTMYVVAEGPDGMYLIDQHAAHERVLYERFLAAARDGQPESQGLLEPITVELSAAHQALLLQHAAAFTRLGFDVEHFGDRAFVVRAVPSMLADDPARRMGELLDRMQRDDGADDASHRAAASLACHASVRAGTTLNAEEQRALLRALEGADQPRTCPHGRPTVVHLAADALAREFRRK